MWKFIALALIVSTSNVYSHEASSGWAYPMQCCSGIDCRQIQSNAVHEVKTGYVINKTGELIGFKDPRLKNSPDGEYHWCSVQGKENTPTVCLFVPPQGS